MPDFRFVCAKTTVQPTSGYATRIPQITWSEHEDLIRRLHNCGSSRDDIIRTLANEYNFHPSHGQLRDQMARWGLKVFRNNKTKSGSDRDGPSNSSLSGSDKASSSSTCPDNNIAVHFYANVPDESLAATWSQFELGSLTSAMVIEMEFVADTCFLGQRYLASYNLYSSIYHAIAHSHRYNNADFAASRFRALIGCLRSCANSEQRKQIVLLAEQELHRCTGHLCCEPGDVHSRRHVERSCGPTMVQFQGRESFRLTTSVRSDIKNVNEVVGKLHPGENYLQVLKWCFDRLGRAEFVSIYNELIHHSGGGVTCWTSGGTEALVYWYLVVEALNNIEVNLPRLTIRHASDQQYSLSFCETLAVVAGVIISESWIFSLNQLPLDSLQRWLNTIIADSAMFETLLQSAIRAKITPNFATRFEKTKSDVLGAANAWPVYRMPQIDILKRSASCTWLMATPNTHVCGAEETMEIYDTGMTDSHQITFEDLVREHASMIKHYVDENCAYGTSYQLRENPQITSRPAPLATAVRRKLPRSITEKSNLASPCDPTLTGSMRGSTRSSFRSFQSTHMRTRDMFATNWPEVDTMSLDSKDGTDHGWHLSFPVGIR